MKKITFATLSFIILFAAQQVAATNDLVNPNTNNNQGALERKAHANKQEDISITQTSVTPMNSDFKNHGQYVSSVAHEHPGGAIVSEAAKSSIGKDEKDNNDGTGSPSVTPTITPTTSPSETPSVTPSITETPSITPTDTPTATPSVTITPTITPIDTQTLVTQLQTFLEKLQNLITDLKNSLHV